ncbi:AAA family ATPase [Hymenobacter glacieicola]|uniref:ATPase AAA-type core domain-containing protein n=1 Tax=Hymenobacter glacieicola TaxID=1562124 RepID=A0ABQ1WEV4_9BACT|nr:ATP-binding protein [Hymenobacter glacieicola]GGG28015.1 hypothetical protein GCM10011378_01060 [Hymenobacter glacieicola]
MNFISRKEFKSLTPFEWNDIAPLSIITGLNGVGKTQLLHLMQSAFYNSTQGGTNQTDNEVFFENYTPTSNNLYVRDYNYGFSENSFSFYGLNFLTNAIYEHCFLNKHIQQYQGKNSYGMQGFIDNYFDKNESNIQEWEAKNMLNRFINVVMNKPNEIKEYIIEKSNKEQSKIKRDDIAINLPVHIFLQDRDLARNDGTDFLFFMHQYKKVALKKQGVESDGNQITPWSILNEVIEATNLPYIVNEPSAEEMEKIFSSPFSRVDNDAYKVKLLHRDNQTEIGFHDLSSGEKVLMSLALTLFFSQEIGSQQQLMLLDEPDAHLHPSMAKLFFNVIYDVLIKNHGTQVVMTTHSASTISLAPEVLDCGIYVLGKGPTSITKVGKQTAIDILSEGLILVTPYTKYILVEGINDKPFFESIYKKLSDNKLINPTTYLAFVPGTGKGSVNHWSTGLRNSGLGEVVKGIIDRDNGNTESPGVHLLKRYSIENYLLDPIFVLCAGNRIPDSIPKYGFTSGDEEKIKGFTQIQLQDISDKILEIVENNLPSKLLPLTSHDKEIIDTEYSKGIVLRYPRWFLEKRGKDLLGVFQQQFGPTIDHRSLTLAFKRLDLIPKDLISLFQNLQA